MITYSELIKLDSYDERLNALLLHDCEVNSPRDIARFFFESPEWKTLRWEIIQRDLGFDLGVVGVKIFGKVLVHHIDPLTPFDIEHMTKKVTDPENLITLSVKTHNIIHYGEVEILPEREPGDTVLR